MRSSFLVLVMAACPVVAQVVYVPSSGSSPPSDGWCKFSKPVTVKLTDGKTHTLSDCGIGTIKGYDWTDMQFTHPEANSLLVFATRQEYNPGPSNETLAKDKKPYHYLLVPVSAVAKLTVGEYPKQGLRAVTATFRDEKRKPLAGYLDQRIGSWTFGGEEDLGGFGKGRFGESLLYGTVAEVTFPTEVPEVKVEAKSKVTATLTQLGGTRHELTDVRVKGNKFEFRKGKTSVEVGIDKIARVEVLKAVSPGYLCKVKLKSGEEDEFETYSEKFCGKGTDFYEVIELHAVKTVEFGPADGEAKKPK